MIDGRKVSFIATEDMVPLASSVHRIIENHPMGGALRSVIPIKMKRFADRVGLPKITESVRRTEVYVFYAPPLQNPDLGFAELAKIIGAAHLGSAKSIKIVLLYFWEGRADRKSEARIPINAKELAKVIQHYPTVDGLITYDMHAQQISGMFDIAVDDMTADVVLAEDARRRFPDLAQIKFVSADIGGTKRARKFAKRLGQRLTGIVDKDRPADNHAKIENFIGTVPVGEHCLIYDDLFDTGGTLFGSARYLLEQGVAKITAYGAHGLFNNDPKTGKTFAERCRELGIHVAVTNSIGRDDVWIAENDDWCSFVGVDHLLASAIIESLTPGGSMSKLSE